MRQTRRWKPSLKGGFTLRVTETGGEEKERDGDGLSKKPVSQLQYLGYSIKDIF